MNRTALIATVLLLAGSGVAAGAEPVVVESGSPTVNLVVNFSDDAAYWFQTTYTPGDTAEDLLFALDADPDLGFDVTLDWSDNVGAYMLNGIAYDGHADGGYNPETGEFWNQYVKVDDASAWQMGGGLATHTLTDGCWSGLVYSTWAEHDPVVPEPATVALLAAGGLALVHRRRG